MCRRLLKGRILIYYRFEYHCSLALKDHYRKHGWSLISCEIDVGSNSTVTRLDSWGSDEDKWKVGNIYLCILNSVTSCLEMRTMIDITSNSLLRLLLISQTILQVSFFKEKIVKRKKS